MRCNCARAQALVYVGNQSNWLAGAGVSVLLAREGGAWVVRNQIMAWVS